MLKLFYSDRFVPRLPAGHRFPIAKYGLVREQLIYEGSMGVEQFEEAIPIPEDLILQVHERAYWEAMRDLRITPRAMRKIGFPQSATLVDRSKRSVQGTLSAALHALEYGCGGNLAGGTHHAYADHGEGFCLLNDLAITAQYLLAQQKATKILIVDLDVHQGNGTAKIFAQEERVFTFSVHGATNYPLHKEASDLDLAHDRDTEDAPYLSIVQTNLSHFVHIGFSTLMEPEDLSSVLLLETRLFVRISEYP